MQILNEAHSYATYANAEKRVKAAIEKSGLGNVRYLIIAQPSGRYSPVVILENFNNGAHFFIANNVAVIN